MIRVRFNCSIFWSFTPSSESGIRMDHWRFLQTILVFSASFNVAVGFTKTDELINGIGTNVQEPFNSLETFLHQDSGSWKTHLIKMIAPKAEKTDAELPEKFDAREKWPDCPTIGHIYDQSACGSSWAIASASVMSDRICIESRKKVSISANDLMTCCKNCTKSQDGCLGGFVSRAWHYWVTEGIVTGGDYGSEEGCKPYPFPKCSHAKESSSKYSKCSEVVAKQGNMYSADMCSDMCADNRISSQKTKYTGKQWYYVPAKEQEIMREIYKHGPVSATFNIYESFFNYTGGIYSDCAKETSGRFLGKYSVKILGWGKDETEKYWLVANSWNEEWGENGFFRIRRGNNTCKIEGDVVAGKLLLTGSAAYAKDFLPLVFLIFISALWNVL
ncbi:hypothetical protein AB6A40_001931 [Gnathostoma spinigerum]|uniref:Peptidase C1A papain C-terminal domain-containing protein n=1 Tax=Gnathostoma spinigerum TaxID=75299 RepID=A0ABD6E7H8_9BILA